MLDGTIPELGSPIKLGDLLGGSKVRPQPAADLQQEPSPFAGLIDDCVAAGLLEAVLPVVPAKAQTEPHLTKNRGKIPGEHIGGNRWRGFVGWTKHVTSKTDVATWRRWPDAGLCIRTAVLPSLDIDVEDATIAAALDKLVRLRVGPGVLVRTRGSSPRRAFLFRVDGPVWKRRLSFRLPGDDRLHAVDLLGNGQQLVLAGEHPSGARYELEAPGLSGVTLDDIPELSIAQLDSLWDEIGKTIADGGGRAIETQSRSARELPERRLGPADAVMREIMRRREQWVPSLLAWGPGAADKEWRIDPEALDRDELEEDLVVYRDGIFDFGTERWHDPLSLIREFGAVAPDDDIEFGGSPDYGPRDSRPFAVVGECDGSVRRPTEGEALGWLSRCLGGPALSSSVTRAEALPVLARAVGLDWNDLSASQTAEWFDAEAAASAPASEPARPKEKAGKFTLVSLDEAADAALTSSTAPLIDGLLDQGAMSVLYGNSNVGKTFVTMDLAYHVAAGRPWGGMRTEKRSVVYVAAEGGAGVMKRAAALRTKYGPCAGFQLLPSPVNLLDPDADLGPLIALLSGVESLGLIVLDTLSRVMAGGDENSSSAMGALVRHFDAVRSATSAHLLAVHHTGKNAARGARGHSLLRAATDTEIEVDSGTINVTKQRDLDKTYSAAFRLEPVLIGSNDRGRAISSCTLKLVGRGQIVAGDATPKEAEVHRALSVATKAEDKHDQGVKIADVLSALVGTNSTAVNVETVRSLLRSMEAKNLVERIGRGAWRPRDIHASAYFEEIEAPEEAPKKLPSSVHRKAVVDPYSETPLFSPSGDLFN